MARRPHVVVVGAGFAGLNATHALRHTDVDVTLVDRHDYHTFQPLLYQVATAFLAPEEVGAALHAVFRRQRNVTIRVASVTGIDWEGRQVALDDRSALAFDYLIVTTGAQSHFLGIPGVAEHSWPLYTLPDAFRLRRHLLRTLETQVVARQAAPLTAVVVGGGPTGVETAGALTAMAHEVIGPGLRLRVVLVEAADRLLTGFGPRSSQHALADLRGRGVEVRLEQAVERADADGVTLAGGERIDARTIVWAAGVRASDLAGNAGLATARQGRILVDEQLRVPGREGVYAAGDVAAIRGSHSDAPLPMLAPVAIQSGRHAGEQVARAVSRRPLTGFRYHDKGVLAVLGRGDAVAELPLPRTGLPGSRPTLRLRGLLAWLLWVGVHIVYLIGFRNRLKVLVDWGWSYFTSRGAGAILLDLPVRPEPSGEDTSRRVTDRRASRTADPEV